MLIRPVVPGDFDQILAFWNPLIRETSVTFSDEEKTHDNLDAMVRERRAQGFDFLVATDGPDVLGLATYGPFRSNNGYRFTVEHTIILAPQARGHGTGRALMTAIEAHARAAGMHSIYAGVSGENAAGIAFHAAIGYREVARLPESGFKFGRWLDLVLMVKFL